MVLHAGGVDGLFSVVSDRLLLADLIGFGFGDSQDLYSVFIIQYALAVG